MRARPLSSNPTHCRAASGLRRALLLPYCIALLWLFSGCAVYQSVVDKFDFDGHTAAAKNAAKKDASTDKTAQANSADRKNDKKSEKTDASANSQAMKEMLVEIEKVGATDPAARDELLKDLKQSDPSLWPMEIRAYRAAAAYHQRHESKETEITANDRANAPWKMPGTIEGNEHHVAKASALAEHGGSSLDATRPAFAPEQLNNEQASAQVPLAPDPASVVTVELTPEATSTAPTALSAIASRAAIGSAFTSAPVSAASQESSNVERAHPDANKLKPLVASAARLIASPEDAAGGTAALASMAGETRQASYLAQDLQASSGSSAFATQVAYVGAVAATTSGDRTNQAIADPHWQEHLAETIRSLEANHSGSGEGDIAVQARLRMLYLLAGRRDDAMRPLPAAPKASQDYWTKQIYGLSTWLDTQGTPDNARRAAATKQILDEALVRLGETAPLGVRNLSFCSAVKSYGSITPFPRTEFSPGQEVLLYAEVENFRVEATAKGNHTKLKVNYQIFDGRGQRVAEHESPPVEEYCQSPRRDFFVSYGLFLPKHPYPGKYKLQLTIEDLIKKETNSATVEFTMKGD